MFTTFLSDEVISPTDLRTNQRHWLDRASENVVTIVTGRKQFALISRERIGKLYAQKYYSELVLRYFQEVNSNIGSTIFPWVKDLDGEEKSEFNSELLSCIMQTIITNDWSSMEYLLEDWKATAEVNNNSEVAEALLVEESPSTYVKSKD